MQTITRPQGMLQTIAEDAAHLASLLDSNPINAEVTDTLDALRPLLNTGHDPLDNAELCDLAKESAYLVYALTAAGTATMSDGIQQAFYALLGNLKSIGLMDAYEGL